MGFISEFKTFILRGNVVDLAVGVIIGGAFGKIVSALVDNILMPIIGVLMQGKNFSTLSLKVGRAEVKYGLFIQNTIDFLIVAVVLFAFIKGVNSVKKKGETPPAAPVLTKEEQLLTEIRDLLKHTK